VVTSSYRVTARNLLTWAAHRYITDSGSNTRQFLLVSMPISTNAGFNDHHRLSESGKDIFIAGMSSRGLTSSSFSRARGQRNVTLTSVSTRSGVIALASKTTGLGLDLEPVPALESSSSSSSVVDVSYISRAVQIYVSTLRILVQQYAID